MMINMNRRLRYLDKILGHVEELTEYFFKSETIWKLSDENAKSIQKEKNTYIRKKNQTGIRLLIFNAA